MEIINRWNQTDLTDTVKPSVFTPDKMACKESGETELIHEHVMDVYVNDVLAMRLVCSPEYLIELALGRLYTEGLIADPDAIERIYLCDTGKRMKIFLKDADVVLQKIKAGVTPTCCTGNIIYSAGQKKPANTTVLSKAEIYAVIKEELPAILEAADAELPVYKTSRSVHNCLLFKGSQLLFCCEDIGRHNAIDKAVGYALAHGIKLSLCRLYTSGRMPVDMVEKVINSGVRILIGRKKPTCESVELAHSSGLCIIQPEDERRILCY